MPIIPKRKRWDKVENKLLAILQKSDFIVIPVTASGPWAVDYVAKDALEVYYSDVYTVLASLGGLPAISVPLTFGNRKVNLPSWLLPIMSASCWHSVKIDGNWHQITRYFDNWSAFINFAGLNKRTMSGQSSDYGKRSCLWQDYVGHHFVHHLIDLPLPPSIQQRRLSNNGVLKLRAYMWLLPASMWQDYVYTGSGFQLFAQRPQCGLQQTRRSKTSQFWKFQGRQRHHSFADLIHFQIIPEVHSPVILGQGAVEKYLESPDPELLANQVLNAKGYWKTGTM